VYRLAQGRPILVLAYWAAALAGWADATGAQTAGGTEYHVYRCQHKTVAEVERLLTDLLTGRADVHLVADTRSNSLLLRGPTDAQQIARSLLEQVDRPAARPPDQPAGRAVVRAYPCPPADLDHWHGVVQSLCGRRTDVRITVQRETSELYVLAPPEVHIQLNERLAVEAQRAHAPPGAGSAVSPARPLTGPVAGPVTGPMTGPPISTVDIDRLLHVRSRHVANLEQQLIALFGRRLGVVRRDGIEVFVLPIDAQRRLEYQIDHARNVVQTRGPAAVVEQFARLIDALDTGGDRGTSVRALHVERTAPSQLEQTIDAYRGELPRGESGSDVPTSNDQTRLAPGGPTNAVRLVNYLFQPQAAGGPAAAAIPKADGDPAIVVPAVPGLEDLEIQTLPDLDVIILRGRDQDVEQLTKIIRELERLSAETKPKIHIYPLKHTQGESVARIVAEVQADLVGRRQGRVTVTPLVKPNALLLIGWGEAVDSIIELIVKLDRPVPPQSQFLVFPLRHAAVTDVQGTLEEFFGARGGLGPAIQTAADTRTNSLIVYAAPRDMEEVQRLVRQLDVPRSEAVNRVQIFRVTNALASDVAQTLQQAIAATQAGQSGRSAVLELLAVDEAGQQIVRSGMLGEVQVTPNPRNNTLIVTGPPEAMELIAAFIRQLDTPGDRAQIKVFRVINGDATNLVTMLRSLLPSQVGSPELGPQLPSAPEEDSLVPLRFTVEVRSNSIIAVGSEGDLQIVEALLTRLDESEGMTRRNVVYLLKNSAAIDVATAISNYLTSQRRLMAAEPGQSNPFQDLEREVIVVPEAVGNRLIVSATPRYFDEITQLIDKLDEPPPQVVIQVLIAEIELGNVDEFGVELGLQDSVLFDRSLLGDLLTTTNTTQVSDPSGILTSTQETIQGATNKPGFDFNNKDLGNSGSTQSLATAKRLGGQALSSFALARMNADAGFGGLVLSASSQNISILIRALQQNREIRILSRPLIRTLDNQPAFIQAGQRVPRIVGSAINVAGQSNSIELENVGLILGVTPRISPDGNVVMEIDAEKSKVGPEAEGIPVSVSTDGTIIRSPRVDTVTAQTTVSVADGETVVLGGIISTGKEIDKRRAPYLSDIPILGHLFRFDSLKEKRTELLIVLTPRVIRGVEDSERIKQAEFARMSWCAAEVHELYGDIGINFHTSAAMPNCAPGRATEIIYPDINPRGTPRSDPHELPQMLPGTAPTDTLIQQPER